MAKNKTYIYLSTDNSYYCFLQARIIAELIKKDAKSRHIIIPCFGIRYHQSSQSKKLPKTLKKALNSLHEFKQERKRLEKCKKHFIHFLGSKTFSSIYFATQSRWTFHLAKAYLNINTRIQLKARHSKKEHFGQVYSQSGILCGDLCADTFMRYKPNEKIDLDDDFFLKVMIRCNGLIGLYKRLFKQLNPCAIIGSDTTYIHHGIPHRVGAFLNIPTVTLAGLEENFRLHRNRTAYSQDRQSQTSYCRDYASYSPDRTKQLPKEVILQAETSLQNRLASKYDNTFAYMNKGLSPALDSTQSCKGRALIMLHDFFDASHIYRWKIFSDFHEWATETINFGLKHAIPLAIKPHPAQIPESERVVASLKRKYSQYSDILWLDKSQRNAELFQTKPQLILSMYGSVAAEATFAGIPVLLGGDHPGINFNIGYVANDKEEYFQYLLNYKHAMAGSREHAISFTAQHYYNNFTRENDSLKSHININEQEWDCYLTYEREDVAAYGQLIAARLYAQLNQKDV